MPASATDFIAYVRVGIMAIWHAQNMKNAAFAFSLAGVFLLPKWLDVFSIRTPQGMELVYGYSRLAQEIDQAGPLTVVSITFALTLVFFSIAWWEIIDNRRRLLLDAVCVLGWLFVLDGVRRNFLHWLSVGELSSLVEAHPVWAGIAALGILAVVAYLWRRIIGLIRIGTLVLFPLFVLILAAGFVVGLKSWGGASAAHPPRYFANPKASYSFFVAGHTYGAPGVNNPGFHPPFKSKFDFIRAIPKLKLGILTGDVVYLSTEEDWDEVDDDIRSLAIPVHIAAGNHDVTNRELFLARYGRSYYAFEQGKDLFIVLDPNIDGLNISGPQLSFLKKTLGASKHRGNVFVFFHQVIWSNPENSFDDSHANAKASKSNFWTDVEPLFRNIRNQVFIFAGDVGGARDHLPTFFRYDNIRLITSGMGGGENDNFLVVTVYSDGSAWMDLVWINEKNMRSRRIEDFSPVVR